MTLAANRSSLSMTLFACVGFITAGASADFGVVEATGAFQLPGASTTTYVSAVGVPGNTRIQGFDFGLVLAGETLTLQNFYFENYAYNNAGNGPGTTNDFLNSNSTASLNVIISEGSNLISNTNYALKQTAISVNNRKWDMATGTNTNLAAGLANGAYTATFNVIYTYWQVVGATASTQTASTGPSTGTFSVLVPAPGAFALLGMAGLVSRRRRNELA